jgi:hypothetical protein
LSHPPPLPASLPSLISKSKPIPTLVTPASSSHSSQKGQDVGLEESDLAAGRLRRFIEDGSDAKVTFRNPCQIKDQSPVIRRQSS